MKKILGVSLLALAFAGMSVLPVSALTFEDVQAQVRELMARISALTAQLNQLKTTQSVVQVPVTATGAISSDGYQHRVCAFLKKNLSQGMSGDDVRSVQEFLQSEGYLQTAPTGYFGPLTGQALAKWQAKEGLAQAGVLGPLSRERIQRWCGGGGWNNSERFSASPTRGTAPLTVVFDSWLSGFRVASTYYVIDFGDGSSERAADCYAPADACLSPGQNKHIYTQNGSYTAVLNKVTDPCGGNPMCRAALQYTPVAKQEIIVGSASCTKEYKPVCASKQVVCITTPCNPVPQTYSNRCMAAADGASFLYEGACRADWQNPADDPRCKSWYDGCNSCSRESATSPAMCTLRACLVQERPYCTAYFDTASNRAPTISSFSGPTTLQVNTSGSWSVQASDPENGQLTYSIKWGDEAIVYPYGAAMSSERAFIQNTSFTHAYASAGTYTVVITVRDAVGNTAEARTTVSVGSNVACTADYVPVCGQSPWTCPSGMYCATVMPAPKTYSNRCLMNADNASFLYEGACTTSLYQCPNDPYCSCDATGRTVVCQ